MDELSISSFTFNNDATYDDHNSNKRHRSDMEYDTNEPDRELFNKPSKPIRKRQKLDYSKKRSVNFPDENFNDTMNKQLVLSELFTNGTDPLLIRSLFTTHAITLPCIYRISLGKVKDLRGEMRIPYRFNDDDIVCKIGRSDDFSRRLKDHYTKYSKITGVSIRVLTMKPIYIPYLIRAESKLKNDTIVKNIKLDFNFEGNNETELIVVSKENSNTIDNLYKTIYEKYGFKMNCLTAPLTSEINELKLKVKELESRLRELQDSIKISELETRNNELEAKYRQLQDLCQFIQDSNKQPL